MTADKHGVRHYLDLRWPGVAVIGFMALNVLYWTFEVGVSLALWLRPEIVFEEWFIGLIALEILGIPLYGLTAIVFIAWSYVAHRNLEALGREQIEFSHGGAIYWWLVPIANLFNPYRFSAETVRGSISEQGDGAWRTNDLPLAFQWWTGLFLANLLMAAAISLWPVDPNGGVDLVSSIGLAALVRSLLAVGAAGACAMWVNRVTDAQAELHTAHSALEPPAYDGPVSLAH